MELISMEGKANFFERRVSSYRKSHISFDPTMKEPMKDIFKLYDHLFSTSSMLLTRRI